MTCPKCQSEAIKVINSRPSAEGQRRRRKCLVCDERFSTVEILAEEALREYLIVCAADGEVLAVISDGEIIEKKGISVVRAHG